MSTNLDRHQPHQQHHRKRHTPDEGENTPVTADNATENNPWRYASGYYDTETGMLKYGTRYYMPNLARWTQVDPKAGSPSSPFSLNPYLYAAADPIDRADRSGRSWFDILNAAGSLGTLAYDESVGHRENAAYDALGIGVGLLASAACVGILTPTTGVGEVVCGAVGVGVATDVTYKAMDDDLLYRV